MSKSRTIGTLFASIALGAVAFLISTPNKTIKRKATNVVEPRQARTEDQELFI